MDEDLSLILKETGIPEELFQQWLTEAAEPVAQAMFDNPDILPEEYAKLHASGLYKLENHIEEYLIIHGDPSAEKVVGLIRGTKIGANMQNDDEFNGAFSTPEEGIEVIEQSKPKKKGFPIMAMMSLIAGLTPRPGLPNPHQFKHRGSKKGYKPKPKSVAVLKKAKPAYPTLTNNERTVLGRCIRRGLTVLQYRKLYPHA